MPQSQSVSSGQSRLQTVFFHPMLVASLLLHGGFLFMPLPTAPEPPAEAEEIEEEPIELSLESLIAPPPAPSPEPVAAPEPTVAVAAAPPPVPQAQPVYTPLPVEPEPTPEASPMEEAPVVEESPAEAAATDAPATPAETPFDPLPLQTAFASNLEGMDGDLTAQGITPSPITFEEPEQFFTSRSVRAEPLPGIHQMRWLNNRRAEEVSNELQQRYVGSNMTFVEVPDGYGGGELFAIQNPEGQTFFYLNIVPGKGGASTVLVIWAHNPNEPAPTRAGAM